MFIKVTQSGNRHYAQLVESLRNQEDKPRQRTVCTLIASPPRARGIAPGASAFDGLLLTDSRHAGDIWGLSGLWRSLGFDDLATAWRRSKTEVASGR